MKVARCMVANAPAIVSRSGYTGEDGFEISIDAIHAERVAHALLGEPEVLPIGLGARDSLRLEAGLCLYGHDIDETTDPVEANLVWSIAKRRKMAKDFPAADAIMDRLFHGAARKRVGLRPDGRAPAREGAQIADQIRPRRRQGHQRRLRPQPERTHRHGLCRNRLRGRRHGPRSHRARQAAGVARRAAAFRPPPLPESPMSEIRFTDQHEWVRVDGDEATIGITKFAAEKLGDVVFVELPEAGRKVGAGGEIAVVESVKAASDVYSPVSGEVTAANDAIVATPDLVNADPEVPPGSSGSSSPIHRNSPG